MTAASFEAWWDFCQLPEHDGHANDTPPGSSDPPTRWGFTYPTWVRARRYIGTRDGSMATFLKQTQNDMRELAQCYFWDRRRADDMSAGNDISVIDWSWTSGGAIDEIQRELGFSGYDVDGAIGPKTLEAIESFVGPCFPGSDERETFPAAVHRWRYAYYDDLGLRHRYPGLYKRSERCFDLALRLQEIA